MANSKTILNTLKACQVKAYCQAYWLDIDTIDIIVLIESNNFVITLLITLY